MRAAEGGHAGATGALLALGADPGAACDAGLTALDRAVAESDSHAWGPGAGDAGAVARRLLGAGADPERVRGDGSGFTPLLAACEYDHAGGLAALLEWGADPARRDARGRTPATVAAAAGSERALRVLAEWAARRGPPAGPAPAGAGPAPAAAPAGAPPPRGRTPLTQAALAAQRGGSPPRDLAGLLLPAGGRDDDPGGAPAAPPRPGAFWRAQFERMELGGQGAAFPGGLALAARDAGAEGRVACVLYLAALGAGAGDVVSGALQGAAEWGRREVARALEEAGWAPA